jgi:uncharacterized protein with GYD domain
MPLAKYAFFFSYTSDAWARMINSPGDRTAAVRQLADSAGGSAESAYRMLGTHDGILIADVPDSVSAAALSIAVTSTGAFKNVQTHELLTQQQVSQTLQLAKDAQVYRPPGQQG